MSGVWVFRNGDRRLEPEENKGRKCKALLHTPSGEVVSSYSSLEAKLTALGWERYYEDPDLLQYHKRSSVDLISLPKDFARFGSVHMYDIVTKNPDAFRAIDA